MVIKMIQDHTTSGVPDKGKVKPILLDWSDRKSFVIVTPEDEDRFFLTVEDAINACKSHSGFTEFQRTFKDLLTYLARWIERHREKIKEAYLTVRETDMLFLTVHTGKSFDWEFEDSLTELDVFVAQADKYKEVRLNVLCIPNAGEDSVISFLDPDSTLSWKYAQ